MVRALFGLALGLGVLWAGSCLGQEGAAAVADAAAAAPAEVAVAEVPAAAVASLNQGDQAWLLTSCALVLLMSPGLAFFYGGLVGRKNVLSVLMQCFMCMCLITILWTVCGYSIAFSGTESLGHSRSVNAWSVRSSLGSMFAAATTSCTFSTCTTVPVGRESRQRLTPMTAEVPQAIANAVTRSGFIFVRPLEKLTIALQETL